MIGLGGAGFGVFGCLAAAAVALMVETPPPVVVPYDPATGLALPNATVETVSLAERPAIIEAQIYRYILDREVYNQLDNDLRLRWLMGTGSTVNANLTHINRTHPRYGQRDYNGFNFGAGVDWALTGKTSLSTSISHTLDAYAASNSNYSGTDKISVSAGWQISPKVGLRLKNDWAQRSYLGSPSTTASSNRQDITRDTTLSVNWQAHEQLALSASLQQSSRGVNQANLDYDSTMLFFTAQLTY